MSEQQSSTHSECQAAAERRDALLERVGEQLRLANVDQLQAEAQRNELLVALRDVIDELKAIEDLEITISAVTAIMRASAAIEKVDSDGS